MINNAKTVSSHLLNIIYYRLRQEHFMLPWSLIMITIINISLFIKTTTNCLHFHSAKCQYRDKSSRSKTLQKFLQWVLNITSPQVDQEQRISRRSSVSPHSIALAAAVDREQEVFHLYSVARSSEINRSINAKYIFRDLGCFRWCWDRGLGSSEWKVSSWPVGSIESRFLFFAWVVAEPYQVGQHY